MYILFIIVLGYFIYYKYNTILDRELKPDETSATKLVPDIDGIQSVDHFENQTIKNSYIKMNVPININQYSLVGGEINTIPYYLANSFKFILGDNIKLNIITKTKTNLDQSNIDGVNSSMYNFAICTEYELLKMTATRTSQTSNPKKVTGLENIRVICSLGRSYLFFIVHDNSGIKSLKDLGGKKVGIDRNGGTYSILSDFSSILGLGLQNLPPTGNIDQPPIYYETGEINKLFNRFYNKQIDCLFLVSGHNIPYIFSLTEKIPIRILDINEPELDSLKKNKNDFFFLTRTKINIEPYDTFNNSRYLDTFYTRDIFICNSNLPPQPIYNITKNLFNNIGSVKSTIVKIGRHYFDETQDPLYDDYKKEYMVYSNYRLPVHSGSYLYYKEIKMYVSEKKRCEFMDGRCSILPYEKIRSFGEPFLN
tara:strand:+ start:1295 stop:2563 length:1269 start_codon:yes stop_codon:yes gene_type:complete